MSAVDAILQRSRVPGRFVERRRFTLSRDKAIEKLREFALREPAQYVLELVQAAVFADARWIAVDVTHRRLLFAWVGGQALPSDGLENIFDYLFASQTSPETRPMTQLAIALNAILQRKPSLLRIESGDGTPQGTVRLDLDKHGEAILGTPEQLLEGTYLLAEFGSQWLPRLPTNGQPQEASIIEETCRYTPVPILLNGTAPFGYRATREFVLPRAVHQSSFDDGTRRGVLAPPGDFDEHEVEIVVGGVRITRISAEELTGGPPVVGVICDDTLRKTADQSDIVRDERWLAMRHAIREPLTLVVRHRVPDYQHPTLPSVSETPSERRAAPAKKQIAPEPLPEFISVVGPGLEVHCEGLRRLDPREPLFFVPPGLNTEMAACLDPATFPYRVLVLRDSQAVTFRKEFPESTLSRLTGPADVDFVRTAIQRRAKTVQVSLQVSIPGRDGKSLVGNLLLQHHLGGPLPGWGDPESGDMPVLVTHNRETILTARLPIEDLGISVRFDSISHWSSEQKAQLTDAVLTHAWRVAFALQEASEDEFAATFTGKLLGVVAVPFFIETGERTCLEVVLPVSWPDETKQLLDIDLTGGEPGRLTARDLSRLQGGDTVLPLSSIAHLDALEQKLGMGHLSTPLLERSIVLGVGWTGDQWQVLHEWPTRMQDDDTTLRSDVIAAAIVLPTLRSEIGLHDGWTIRRVVAPGILQVERVSARGDGPRWGDVMEKLTRALQREQHHRVDRSPISRRRGTERMRLALVQLSQHADDAAGHLQGLESLGATVGLDGARVLPRHGPQLLEPNTLCATLDELHSIQKHLGHRMTLRFDDPPDVWESLITADEEHWLLREEAHEAGLRATLGLRFPHDDTTGVFLSSTDGYLPLPQVDQWLPCHGLAVLTGGALEPTTPQVGALLLARKRLYRTLDLGLQEKRWTGAKLEAATRYHKSAQDREQAGRERPLQSYLLQKIAIATEDRQVTIENAIGTDDRPIWLTWGLSIGLLLKLNRRHPLVRQARDGLESARGLLLTEALRLLALEDYQSAGEPIKETEPTDGKEFNQFARGLVRLAIDEESG